VQDIQLQLAPDVVAEKLEYWQKLKVPFAVEYMKEKQTAVPYTFYNFKLRNITLKEAQVIGTFDQILQIATRCSLKDNHKAHCLYYTYEKEVPTNKDSTNVLFYLPSFEKSFEQITLWGNEAANARVGQVHYYLTMRGDKYALIEQYKHPSGKDYPQPSAHNGMLCVASVPSGQLFMVPVENILCRVMVLSSSSDPMKEAHNNTTHSMAYVAKLVHE